MTTEDTYFANDNFIDLMKAAFHHSAAAGKMSAAASGRRDTHA